MHPVLKNLLNLWRSDKAYPIEVVYPWDVGETVRRRLAIAKAGISRRFITKIDAFDLYFFRTELDASIAEEASKAVGCARPLAGSMVNEEGLLVPRTEARS